MRTYPALAALTVFGGLMSGCTEPKPPAPVEYAPKYKGIEKLRLSGELVELTVTMAGARAKSDVSNYARCMAAQYALEHGYAFARHVWTNVAFEGGIWRADAVYTVSSTLPKGLRTIDAEVIAQDCVAKGIPTV